MMKISVNRLETIFGKKVKLNLSVLGVDTSTRTGFCKIKSTEKFVTFEYGFIELEGHDKTYRYNQFIDLFKELIHDIDVMVIEDTFLRFNVKVFQLLTRLGGFVYAIGRMLGIKHIEYITPKASRAFLGLDCKAKKEVVQTELKEKFKELSITDDDALDAVVLALCGLLEDNKLDV